MERFKRSVVCSAIRLYRDAIEPRFNKYKFVASARTLSIRALLSRITKAF